MELKDVVLQTLSEIENSVDEKGFKESQLRMTYRKLNLILTLLHYKHGMMIKLR